MAIHIEHHDSHLGRWLLARWSPRRLAAAVEYMWYFEGRLAHARERIFPDGTLELIVHLGAVYRQVEANGTQPYSRSCIGGLMLGSSVIEAPTEPCAVVGVRLRPPGAYALLRRPLHELTGITVDLADLIGAEEARLSERCAGATTPEETLRAAAAWIAERVLPADSVDAAVGWVAGEIERRAGAVSISDLQRRTGWSRSRFGETFRRQIGVSPKRFARILRFRRALELVNRGVAPLSEVALAAGYYDQPHFNAEFRELSSFAPGEFLAAQRYPASVSVAEAPR